MKSNINENIKFYRKEKHENIFLKQGKPTKFLTEIPIILQKTSNSIKKEKPAFSGDNFGVTAMEGIENTMKTEKNNISLLYDIWQEIKNNAQI